MKDKNNNKDETVILTNKNINWHTGFIDAMEIELRHVGCEIKTIPEKQFVSQESKIDMLIEKTSESSEVTGLGRYLRRFTFCEFKSPGHSLNARVFHRLISLSVKHFVDDLSIMLSDIAVMFVSSHHPREVFKELPTGWVVEKSEAGIYIIRGAEVFTSVVVVPELPEETYKWLSCMKHDLTIERLKILITEYDQNEDDVVLAKLLGVVLEINIDKIEKGEFQMQKLMTVIEQNPYGAKLLEERYEIVRTESKAEGRVEGKAEGKVEGKAEGKAEGRVEGKVEGKAESIIRILTKRFDESVPMKLQNQIMTVNNIDKLDELFDFAWDCVSIGEFSTAFN
ncbi:MAG: hypothetical protein LBP59_17850 [Planctomycetaceae bacterium]|jgi:hypothetical protein|nr:hypothetical protein [Planctomycetaceae bacterium]